MSKYKINIIQYFFRVVITVLLSLIILLSLFFLILHYPISLQKALTIKSASDQKTELQNYKYGNNNYEFDIEQFISSIPYNNDQTMYTVLPKNRFEESILNGDGNCSNLVYGAAYYLLKKNLDFEIVYMLPVDNFLFGYGHTLLQMEFKFKDLNLQYGIIDFREAVIPTIQGIPKGINELNDPRSSIELYEINSLNRERMNYFDQSYLVNKVFGTVRSEEIKRY